MSSRNGFTAAGVGAVACAACCAAPILAPLTATAIATVTGFMIFGTFAVVVGALVVCHPPAARLSETAGGSSAGAYH